MLRQLMQTETGKAGSEEQLSPTQTSAMLFHLTVLIIRIISPFQKMKYHLKI